MQSVFIAAARSARPLWATTKRRVARGTPDPRSRLRVTVRYVANGMRASIR